MEPPIKIILVKPRNPDNIGACARAMANFGLTELALVSPFQSDWGEAVNVWRAEASVSAIDSMDVINSARIFDSITEAGADCGLLLGTSSLHRINPERDVILLKDVRAHIEGKPAAGKTGIVFGPEKTGLTKEDLSFCQAIINIPTRPRQPSMNLGQSVAVVAYELAARESASSPLVRRGKSAAPPAQEVERAVRQICLKLKALGGEVWGGEQQARAIRQGLIDARLTKSAMHALNLLLKN